MTKARIFLVQTKIIPVYNKNRNNTDKRKERKEIKK